MNIISKIFVFLFTLTLTVAMPAMAAGKTNGGQSKQVSTTSLSKAEKDTLLWMREEEKVARDVYLTLYDVWKESVFSNIASSEQNHMDAILKKIETYQLDDPALPAIGEFSNDELQAMFDGLVTAGLQSYTDALVVGATIEDMDILDLMNAIDETDELDLKTTYESLLEGSKNHLRAFVGLLRDQGDDYEPQYISSELFDAILAF